MKHRYALLDPRSTHFAILLGGCQIGRNAYGAPYVSELLLFSFAVLLEMQLFRLANPVVVLDPALEFLQL